MKGSVLLGPAYARHLDLAPGGAIEASTWFGGDFVAAGGNALLSFLPYERDDRSLFRREVQLAPVSSPALAVEAPLPRTAIDGTWQAAAVAAIRAAIAAGDVYQACLTARVTVGQPGVAGAALFAALHRDGAGGFTPFPWSAWVKFPNGSELISASPECFFRVNGGVITTEPMKGTGPLDGEAALLASRKERAELAMITDLLRNDLTPLCVPKSVAVVAPRKLVRLRYALQMVAEITGTLRDGVALPEILASLHPGGSVVGAPKEAAYALLQTLEAAPRGAYCGALGLSNLSETVHNFGLLIRTGERASPAEPFTFGVGSGIVWGSDAAAEFREWQVKLGVLGASPSPYTVLRKTADGVPLRSLHRARFAASEGAAHAFDEAVDALPEGLHALQYAENTVKVRTLAGSRLATVERVRFAPTPLPSTTGTTGAIAKPAPPCVYDDFRSGPVLTLFFEGDGTLCEADCAAIVGWDGERLVVPPDETPRVASVAEAAVLEAFSGRVRRGSLLRDGAEALAFVNAAGACTLPIDGRAPFPPALLAEIADALRRV
jgi:para-aminobenzoate synthetase/4-amino-4-deoxychorismate lyase